MQNQNSHILNNSTKDVAYINNILLPFISFVIWFLSPVLSIFLFLYFLGTEKISIYKFNIYFLIILVSSSFGLLSYVSGSGGVLETDMIRYRQVFGLMIYRDLSDLWIYGSSYIFILLNWIIANFISSDDQMMSFIFTSVSYFFLILSTYKLNIFFVEKKYHFLVLLSVVFVVSIITTTEYVKQVLSSTIFLYGLVLKLENRKKAYIWIIISVLLHISAVMFLPLYFFQNKYIRNNIIYIFSICLLFSQIDILNILSSFSDSPLMITLRLDEKLNAYSGDVYEGFGGSKRYYLIFIFYVLQVLPIIYHFYRKRDIKNGISVFFILTLCILLVNMSNTHNFARLTRNLYLFQILALIFSIRYIKHPFKKVWIYFIIACLFASNLIEFVRTMNNPEYHATFMGNDWFALVFSNVSDFLNYTIINPL